ncbi:MAG: tripartite tricarboxylate transporter substrate binding protein [Alphaproteobacteria bacterium]
MSLKHLIGLTAATVAMATTLNVAQAAWPEKPITIYCPYSAGGGTDATARFFATGLRDVLGVPVNVVNRTGANGLTGHSAMASSDPDGYTIGLIAQAIGLYHWQGMDLSYKDITPLAMFNFDPAGFQVGPSKAHLKDAMQAIEELKANPQDWNLGGGGRMGSWGMAFTQLALAFDMDPSIYSWIASGGAAPSLTELAAGGIDLAPTSLPEAKTLIDAGKIRALAVMAEKRHPTFPDVPTMEEVTGKKIVAGAWRAIAAPKGLPDDIKEKYIVALRKVWESDEFKEGMDKFGYGMAWIEGAELDEFLAANDANAGKILKATQGK